jgi:hypothetical protein
MSQNVSPYLVLDDRLNISDHIGFGVNKSGANINQQVFTAPVGIGNSSISVNCLIPNLTTVIDRHVMTRVKFTIQVVGTPVANVPLINYPTNFCLANMPFSQLVNQLSVQINNTTVNSNYQDTLDVMLRQMSDDALAKYSDFTPILPDVYQLATTAGNLSPFRDISQAVDDKKYPRGIWSVDVLTNPTSGGANTSVISTLQFTVCEPVFCSPFLFGDTLDMHSAGLVGVSSINFNYNLDSTARRACRVIDKSSDGIALNNAGLMSVSLKSIDSFEVLMTFISPAVDQLIPLNSSLPYYELPCFKTSQSISVNAGLPFTFQSSVIAPSTIPDTVYLAVRNSSSVRTPQQNEFYYPIQQVNITWNNQSGIMGTATVQDLYYMSKKAGLKMSYNQFVGSANAIGGQINANTAKTGLTGNIVVLNFGDMINILETYYCAGSIGTWNFSVSVNCLNNTAGNLANQQVELLTVFMQSGAFTTNSGVSNQYIGVLSKEIVLRTSQEESVSKTDSDRLIGGGVVGSFLKNAKSVAASPATRQLLGIVAPLIKEKLASSDNKYAKLASGALSLAGGKKYRSHPRIRNAE